MRAKNWAVERQLHPAACEHCCRLIAGQGSGIVYGVFEVLFMAKQVLLLAGYYFVLPALSIVYFFSLLFAKERKRELSDLRLDHGLFARSFAAEAPSSASSELRNLPNSECLAAIAREKQFESLYKAGDALNKKIAHGQGTIEDYKRYRALSAELDKLLTEYERQRNLAANLSQELRES